MISFHSVHLWRYIYIKCQIDHCIVCIYTKMYIISSCGLQLYNYSNIQFMRHLLLSMWGLQLMVDSRNQWGFLGKTCFISHEKWMVWWCLAQWLTMEIFNWIRAKAAPGVLCDRTGAHRIHTNRFPHNQLISHGYIVARKNHNFLLAGFGNNI